MKTTLIRNVSVVNEDTIRTCDVLIQGAVISKVAEGGCLNIDADEVIDGAGKHLLPGLIDDQVHFREPGLTHKGDLYTESRAAVAGGITSYMEMPNTSPPATTIELLEQKYARASEVSLANYSFFMGTSNHNLEELLKVDAKKVCGVKIFMGSSTGNLLVEKREALEIIFSKVKTLIATHCEDDGIIKRNLEALQATGRTLTAADHPVIRNAEGCYASSSMAVELAKKHDARLHILHISTAHELKLFTNAIPMKEKRITAEACIHHLWFTEEDYATKGNYIKWNPAVKSFNDRMNIREAVNDGRIDVIATDHAPHTIEEKEQEYLKAPSGGPLVQHSLQALIDLHRQGVFTLEKIVEKASHAVADLFQIDGRGYIREGYFADFVMVDLSSPYTVTKENLLYKCGWSPFEGHTFSSTIVSTWCNGKLVFENGKLTGEKSGMALTFAR